MTPDEERFIELGAKIAIIAVVIVAIFLVWVWYTS